jgi:hypothetical protein
MKVTQIIDLDPTRALDHLEDLASTKLRVVADDREQAGAVLMNNWYTLLAVQKVETLKDKLKTMQAARGIHTVGYLGGRIEVLTINALALERKCARIIAAMAAETSRLHHQSSIRPSSYVGY